MGAYCDHIFKLNSNDLTIALKTRQVYNLINMNKIVVLFFLNVQNTF